jgi:hypothetical protein
MQEKLSTRYGENYTDEVNKYWKNYYRNKLSSQKDNTVGA